MTIAQTIRVVLADDHPVVKIDSCAQAVADKRFLTPCGRGHGLLPTRPDSD
jgi:hypothetical protein